MKHPRWLVGGAIITAAASLALASPAGAGAAGPPPAPPGAYVIQGHGNGTFQGAFEIPGETAKVDSALATGQMTQAEADGIPVSATYVATGSNFGQGHAGDPTVRVKFSEKDIVGITLWTFEVTQSFDYNGSHVTWLSPLSWSGTSVSYIWWSINNESSSTSQPATGVWYTQTYANAVYNYCAYWILCSETSYAETWMNFYGDGYWEYSWDYHNSF